MRDFHLPSPMYHVGLNSIRKKYPDSYHAAEFTSWIHDGAFGKLEKMFGDRIGHDTYNWADEAHYDSLSHATGLPARLIKLWYSQKKKYWPRMAEYSEAKSSYDILMEDAMGRNKNHRSNALARRNKYKSHPKKEKAPWATYLKGRREKEKKRKDVYRSYFGSPRYYSKRRARIAAYQGVNRWSWSDF